MVTEYATNETSRRMLDEIDWYIMPVVNPDGYEFTHTSASVQSQSRYIAAHARAPSSCVPISAYMGEWAKWADVIWINYSVYRGVFYSSILFSKKYERSRWLTLRWSEIFTHSAHWTHSPIYAEMGEQLLGARAWAAMYLDRDCMCDIGRSVMNLDVFMHSN